MNDVSHESGPGLPGGYQFVGWLGEGGMGLVAHGRDPKLDRDVAIKLIKPSVAGNAVVHGAFEREAKAMARVRHKNVVEIFAFGETDGVPYFVMEYVPGQTLEDWLEARSFEAQPVDVALGILSQLCAGVDAIHAAGAVHRDLKPGNVLVAPDLRVAVTDLGLAMLDGQQAFKEGTMGGTPAYLAPELVLEGIGGAGDGRPADVYALAVMAYELLAGRLPFDANEIEAVLDQQVNAVAEPPSSFRPELPTQFDAIVLSALAKEPAQRPTAHEFLKRLTEARKSLAASYASRRHHIMVIDDDEAYLAWCEEVLKEGFPLASILTLSDPKAALSEVLKFRPSVVLCDLDMPLLNGVEVTAEVLRTGPPELRVIIVSGRGGADDWAMLNAIGAHRMLLKPVPAAALLATIREVSERGADASMSGTRRIS